MEESGVSKEEVAQCAGVSPNTIATYLRSGALPNEERRMALGRLWGHGCFNGIVETERVCTPFAATVIKRMRQMGMSRKELAGRSAVSPSTIFRLLSGHTKRLKLAQYSRICSVLGLKYDVREDISEEYAAIIKALRHDFTLCGKSAESIAQKAGVYCSTVAGCLRGENISTPKTLENMAKAMGTTLENWRRGITLDKIPAKD